MGDRPVTDGRTERRDLHLLDEAAVAWPQAGVAEPLG